MYLTEVLLKKTGFYVQQENENLGKLELVNVNETDYNLPYYLDYTLSIEDGVNVEDLLTILNNNSGVIDEHFLSKTRGFKIKPYFDDMVKTPTNIETECKYVEFYWLVDEYSFKEENRLECYTSFHGISKVDDVAWGLSYSPICEWKHLPLKVNKTFDISYYSTRKNKMISKLKLDKDFTLRDFISGFLNEITFHGYPEHRDQFMKNLEEMEKDIESGEVEFIPMEKMLLGWEEELHDIAVSEERYEDASQHLKKIKKLKKELKKMNNE